MPTASHVCVMLPPRKSFCTQQSCEVGVQNVSAPAGSPHQMPGLFHTPPLELDEEDDDELDDEDDDEPPDDEEPPLEELEAPLDPLLLLGGGGGGGSVAGGGGVAVLPDEVDGSVGDCENCEPPDGPKRSDCVAPLHAITVVSKTEPTSAARFSMADELEPPRLRCPMPRAHPFRLIRRASPGDCDV